MKKRYKITGMTCNGCRTSVESTLKKIPKVQEVAVDLETEEAIVVSKEKIPIEVFKNELPDKYTITEHIKEVHNLSEIDDDKIIGKSEYQQLFPLFLIFGYISVAAVLLNYNPWNTHNFMLDFMGLFYVVFSFFKMLDLKGFPDSFKMYDPLAKMIPIYGWIYPFIEIGLALLFLMRIEIKIALMLTIILLGITTVGVTKVLLDKKSIQCACLGTALKLPMTKATFIENTVMLVMAVWMLLN